MKRLILFGLMMVIVCAAMIQQSCNFTRTITNKSEFFQKGDTSVMIQTKTVESYDATKRL